ncbi:transposase [Bradyrhizobium sp. JR3.5]
MSETPNTALAVIGIDIGKNSFHVVGHDARGAIVLRQKWSRGQVEARLANLPPCLVGMEACVGAHHLSRKLASLGHDARLMPARYVRPYSKGQKNDFNDAEAIAEAVQRPTMKFVATKTAEQLDLQALHRVRERLVSQRTGIINQIRAFMLERGIAVRQGIGFLRTELPTILATRTDALLPRMLRVIEELAGDWRRLDQRIDGLSGEIEALARQDQACSRLMTVPGIGSIISSAMVAAIGTGDVFSKGRDFGAWLGLVPKQISTGDRTILGKISTGRLEHLADVLDLRSRTNRGAADQPYGEEIAAFCRWAEIMLEERENAISATILPYRAALAIWGTSKNSLVVTTSVHRCRHASSRSPVHDSVSEPHTPWVFSRPNGPRPDCLDPHQQGDRRGSSHLILQTEFRE